MNMSGKILHGRRRGVNKSAGPALPPLPDMSMNGQGIGPGNVDLRQVTILSNTDWERIQAQLNKRKIEEEKVRRAREEKEKLHELSKNQIKNWGNTIAGQRQKKLEARKLREAKEEEERKLVDLEEEKFQASKRKEAIEKAKTQQYYQTDRVKGFHGALLLTEVLKERDAQLELNKLKQQVHAGNDRAWLEKAQREYEEGIKRDQEQSIKRMHKMKMTSDFQKAQIRDHLKLLDNEQEEDNIEGEELKRLAAQYEIERARLDEIRRQEATELMKDNRRQIEDVKKMRYVQNQQEEEEDEECRIFAAAKRKMMKLRAEKERALHIEKQERLEKIREKLHAQMQQKMDDEDERILRAQKETEEKRTKEEAEKEAWNIKMQKEMGDHRHQQMREHERQQAEEKQRELEMLAVSKAADEQFAQNEETKRHMRFQNIKNLQNFHGKQMSERKVLTEKERQELLAEDEENLKLLAIEERQFQEYASKVIDHCEKGGRNVYPLRKAAQPGVGGGRGPLFTGKGGIRPSFMVSDQSGVQMPNYQRATTEDTKQAIYGNGQTNKRLGFVW